MSETIQVTVLTPTYNRIKYLPRLFASLCRQSCKKFDWLIIDDGSTDGTNKYILSLSKEEFEIQYLYKKNGGKHTALNYASNYIRGTLVVIVDSDDYLIPEAIEYIVKDWEKYKNNSKICGLSYLRCKVNGQIYSQRAKEDFYIDDDIHWRVNHRIIGDRCEVLRTDILKKYPFPEFEGEHFMSEGWLWFKVALDYKTVYRNEAIYICEYLEGGLTKSGRVLRMKCPYGMMENCKLYFIPQVRWSVRVKEMILFWVYGFCAGYSVKQIAKEPGGVLHLHLISAWIICVSVLE